METKFKIGDKVKITNCVECYRSYDDMAHKMGLKNWKYGNELTNGDEGMIVAIEQHPSNSDTLCGVDVNGREYIINEKGLEFVGVIKIDRTTLNEYYDAATAEQKKFLNDNFKLDGTTTIKAVKQLHDIACEKWKRIIKKNHPECFQDDKYFTREELEKMRGDDIEVRIDGEYKNKGFYLCGDYNWELKVDSTGRIVLIPTKIK